MHIVAKSAPFRHILLENVFSRETATQLLSELRAAGTWREVVTKSSRIDVLEDVGDALRTLKDGCLEPGLGAIWLEATRRYGVPLETRALVHAHRFRRGCGAALHTDQASPGVRIVLFLSAAQGSVGGNLVIAQPAEPEALTISATHNTGFAFPTSTISYHGVTEQEEGERFSLVLQLSAKGPLVSEGKRRGEGALEGLQLPNWLGAGPRR